MSGKGSKQRPPQVSQAELARRWEMAFGKKDKTEQDLKEHLQSAKPQGASHNASR